MDQKLSMMIWHQHALELIQREINMNLHPFIPVQMPSYAQTTDNAWLINTIPSNAFVKQRPQLKLWEFNQEGETNTLKLNMLPLSEQVKLKIYPKFIDQNHLSDNINLNRRRATENGQIDLSRPRP